MGQSSLDSPIIKMKMFAVLTLAAVAFAEPEPQILASGLPLSTVYNSYSSPLVRAFTPYSAINGVYGAPVVHTLGKRDADADPATVYTTGLPVATYGAVSHVASPLTTVNSVVAPVSSVTPVATYSAVNNVVAPVSTYSAVNNVVPVTHSAVNNVVPVTHSAVNSVVPVTHSAVSSVVTVTHSAVSSVVPVTHSAVNSFVPVTHSAVNGVVSTYSTVNGVVAPVTHSLTSYKNPSHYTAVSNGVVGPKYIAKNHGVAHVVKRDAEPLVSSYYVAGVPSALPATYSTAGHVVKGAYAPHAVAATPFGMTHSSNVGVCTNNMGIQVPC